ncbi:D-amino-acid transaminase [Candidatus Endolissoclinum faulkneri L5]|uniref:Probable branched-chain-amino-acid aminotransferase n=1 Tax=Candidatus Endolissoclinum faulkneri L5 TaxID=1401328 RepID=V9TRT8_9PROT|nr:D-amino-acid transaminase [Candidatus Endolissoclinum faulkneri]AHC73624.1 D-amino-acid transaminase [Candidatus Endolissoclinum faulkneri L5]
MSRIAYVNGRFLRHSYATVHIEDRGYQFADGVYEVIVVYNGMMIDEVMHLDRLDCSLRELCIRQPVSRAALRSIIREIIRLNKIKCGLIYLQVTRGVAKREHPFPNKAQPSIVLTAKPITMPSQKTIEAGVKVITIEDIRWKRRDIKSLALLPNIIGRQKAKEQGAFEAWQVDENGKITEGTSSNAWIVTQSGALITRTANHDILNGTTRLSILKLAKRLGIKYTERSFSIEEAKAAREAFISSATTFVTPVTQIDDVLIGDGRAGILSLGLRGSYIEYANQQGGTI